MKICDSCEAIVDEQDKFCRVCGFKFTQPIPVDTVYYTQIDPYHAGNNSQLDKDSVVSIQSRPFLKLEDLVDYIRMYDPWRETHIICHTMDSINMETMMVTFTEIYLITVGGELMKMALEFNILEFTNME